MLIDNINESEYTYDGEIHSVSDIIDIVSRPHEYFGEILENSGSTRHDPHDPAPLGRNHQGLPRPFPYGIWFRGQPCARFSPIPSIFRTVSKDGRPQFYDERDMFNDLRLRSSHVDLRGFDNIELMGLMQHHAIPTRLMDWTESPLVACFFAVADRYYDADFRTTSDIEAYSNGTSPDTPNNIAPIDDDDCCIYVLNAYRLNGLNNLSVHRGSNIFQPQDIDALTRAVMAEHTYIENVVDKIRAQSHVSWTRGAYDTLSHLNSIVGKEQNENIPDISILNCVMERLSAPVAVMPRRSHPRMDSQLSCFTVHGGKLYHSSTDDSAEVKWTRLGNPIHLHEINSLDSYRKNMPANGKRFNYTDGEEEWRFMKRFKISKWSISRIMIELDRLGITEAMLYPDMEGQSKFVRSRWATVGPERPIYHLPHLSRHLSSGRPIVDRNNYTRVLYGDRPRRNS